MAELIDFNKNKQLPTQTRQRKIEIYERAAEGQLRRLFEYA